MGRRKDCVVSEEKKVEYVWEAVCENLARKVSEEDQYRYDSEEEFQADIASDEARYHRYCLEQQEMYDDPVMNWSGQR